MHANDRVAGFGATVTVLFDDVENSTVLLERVGRTRWLELIGQYEAVLRDRLAVYDGREVKSMGDGHLVVFPSARGALCCAVDVQRALRAEGGPDLSVRMGLHTGEPINLHDDLYGQTVVKASRIASLAHGGEVLASRIVRDLADGDDPIGPDIWFDDPREVELRGLRGRHAIDSVRWEQAAGRRLTVVVADDSAVIRDGVAAVLRDNGLDVKATACDADSLYAEVNRHDPDVVVSDIRMPPTHTTEGLMIAERLADSHPNAAVLVLSQHLELAYAQQLLRDRAARRGYLLKDRIADIEVLLEAIHQVAHGGCVIDPAITERIGRAGTPD